MKKILVIAFLILSTLITSCSSDDGVNFFYELVPIEAVEIPDEFTRGETYELKISYFRPSDCHSFSGFDYTKSDNVRTVAIVNVVFTDRDCEDIEATDLIEESLNFEVGSEDSYVFRFWKNRNDQDENEFITIEVPVVE